ncbi:hypothetical protein DVH24_006213 [Malus domestica]|uniref:Uncharacterized protein n=1 Tax=Malus domestica TaxID=3750 RepID=A0A498KC74_MALDO|nr:hypothetical protein DVH24_006213 [Malus domestica]
MVIGKVTSQGLELETSLITTIRALPPLPNDVRVLKPPYIPILILPMTRSLPEPVEVPLEANIPLLATLTRIKGGILPSLVIKPSINHTPTDFETQILPEHLLAAITPANYKETCMFFEDAMMRCHESRYELVRLMSGQRRLFSAKRSEIVILSGLPCTNQRPNAARATIASSIGGA